MGGPNWAGSKNEETNMNQVIPATEKGRRNVNCGAMEVAEVMELKKTTSHHQLV